MSETSEKLKWCYCASFFEPFENMFVIFVIASFLKLRTLKSPGLSESAHDVLFCCKNPLASSFFSISNSDAKSVLFDGVSLLFIIRPLALGLPFFKNSKS